MKMKKIVALLMTVTMLIALIVACSPAATETPAEDPAQEETGDDTEGEDVAAEEPAAEAPAGNGEITLVNNKIEIHSALTAFAQTFYEKNRHFCRCTKLWWGNPLCASFISNVCKWLRA